MYVVILFKLESYAVGDYSNKVPPLTIPNREVKLISANGTSYTGRVGHCPLLALLCLGGLCLSYLELLFIILLNQTQNQTQNESSKK